MTGDCWCAHVTRAIVDSVFERRSSLGTYRLPVTHRISATSAQRRGVTVKTARMASSHSSRLAVTNRTLRSTEMVSESGVVGGGAAISYSRNSQALRFLHYVFCHTIREAYTGITRHGKIYYQVGITFRYSSWSCAPYRAPPVRESAACQRRVSGSEGGRRGAGRARETSPRGRSPS